MVVLLWLFIVFLSWLSILLRLSTFIHNYAQGKKVNRLIWVVMVSTFTAGTMTIVDFKNPVLAELGGPLFATIAYVLGTSLFYFHLTPSFKRPRIPVLTLVGIVSFLAILGIILFSYSSHALRTRLFLSDIVGNLIFDLYVISVDGLLFRPTLKWMIATEKSTLPRFRCTTWLMTHWFTTIWMTGFVLITCLSLLGINVSQVTADLVFNIPAAIIGSLIIITFILPSTFLKPIVNLHSIGLDWINLFCLKTIQYYSLSWLDRNLYALSLNNGHVTLGNPSGAVYQAVISILDSRKILKSSDNIEAQKFGRALDVASQPHLNYEDVVMRLRKIGIKCLIIQLSVRGVREFLLYSSFWAGQTEERDFSE